MIAKEVKSKSKTKREGVQKEAKVEAPVVEEPTGKRPGRPRKPSVTT